MTTPTAIVGAATAGIGWETSYSAVELMAQASCAAIEDAGLRVRDVDAVYAATPYYWMPSVTLAEQLRIEPRATDSTNIGGASVVAQVAHAMRDIATGRASIALIAYGSTQRSDAGRLVTRAEISSYEKPYGALFPISGYALVAQRHMHEFGTTRAQLAQVAVSASQWASLNPDALKREPLTCAQVENSPLISDPLRKFDICLVTNGAGAIVLCAKDRASRLRQRPVAVLGTGEGHSHCYASSMLSYTQTSAVHTSKSAYQMAGIGPEDINVVQIYDAFTISVIVGLEDLGFCEKGGGGPFVEAALVPARGCPSTPRAEDCVTVTRECLAFSC